MEISEYFQLSGIERKAAKQVYIQFRINRYELNMLMGLSAFLLLHGKRIVSARIYMAWLGLGYREQRKCSYYLWGLETKGAVHRLAYRRLEGRSLSISPFGVKVLQAFDHALKTNSNKIEGDYTDLPINLNTLPDGYILKTKGRD